MYRFKLTGYGRVFYYLANELFQMYLFVSRDRLTV